MASFVLRVCSVSSLNARIVASSQNQRARQAKREQASAREKESQKVNGERGHLAYSATCQSRPLLGWHPHSQLCTRVGCGPTSSTLVDLIASTSKDENASRATNPTRWNCDRGKPRLLRLASRDNLDPIIVLNRAKIGPSASKSQPQVSQSSSVVFVSLWTCASQLTGSRIKAMFFILPSVRRF